MNAKNAVPFWFWVVAGLAVVWNLMGVGAFVGDISMTEADLAQLGPSVSDLYNTRPSWAIIAFAVAVIGGLGGSILLLLRNAWAVQLFGLSLLGVIVQDIYWFGIARAFELFPVGSHVMPVIVFLIAVSLLLFARSANRQGWI